MATQGPLLPEVERVLSEYYAAETTSKEDKDASVEMLAQLSSFTEEDLLHGRAVMKDARSLLKYMNKKLQQKGGGGGGSGSGASQPDLQDVVSELRRVTDLLGSTVQAVQVPPSTCSSWRANHTLQACRIYVGALKYFPCCFGAVLPASTAGIKRMIWDHDLEELPENMRRAARRLKAWVDDEDCLVIDINGTKWLNISKPSVVVKEGKTDLLVVDLRIARALLRKQDLEALSNGMADERILQDVAYAILVMFECKTTKALNDGGGVFQHRSQCKVEFAAINNLCGVYDASQGWPEGAETTVWLGDCNLDQVLALHTVPGNIPGWRELHTVRTPPNPGAHEQGRVLACFREALRKTKAARAHLGAPAPPFPGAPPAVPPNLHNAGGGSQPADNVPPGPGPASMQVDPPAHAGQDPPRGSSAHLATQPDQQHSSDTVHSFSEADDVPYNYHEMVDFNAKFRSALEQTLSKPALLQDLGLTQAELQSRVAGMDAWCALTTVGQKIAMALRQSGGSPGSSS